MHPSHCSWGTLPPLARPPLPHELEGVLQSLYLRVFCQAWHCLDSACGQRLFRHLSARAERGLL